MVVVLSEVFGEFVVGKVTGGDDAMDHAEFLELGQIPIDRANGEFRVGVTDFRNRERLDGRSEHCDEAFTVAGQPLLGGREACEHTFA